MKVKVGLIAFIILGLSFTLYQVLIKDSPALITQKEAEAIATNLYGGKVLNAKVAQENSKYKLMLENEKGIYHLFVDRNTKKISDIKLVERKETLITTEEAKKEIEKELNGKVNRITYINKDGQPFVEATMKKDNKNYKIKYDITKKTIVSNKEMKSNQKAPPPISEREAKEIALQQINGQITNLSIVTDQNGEHYKVTVDGPSQSAHVYVQVNTGEVSRIFEYSKEQPNEAENDDDDYGDDDDDDDE